MKYSILHLFFLLLSAITLMVMMIRLKVGREVHLIDWIEVVVDE